MKMAVKYAKAVTTVSPSYAEEIYSKKYGMGIEKALKKREGKVIGILNGVDYGPWMTGKKRNKEKPLFAIVSRLTSQKGIELVIDAIKDFLEKDKLDFVFLGSGSKDYERAFLSLQKKYPKNVVGEIGYDEEFSHKIYSEADFFLMPSLFEPCGLAQMIAMRSSTLPIVRKTGGLKDTVIDGEDGLSFTAFSAASLERKMREAIKIYNDKPKLEKMRKAAKTKDFSWNKSMEKYIELYEKNI
jgi:starch synthase